MLPVAQILIEDPDLGGDLDGSRLIAAQREIRARTTELPTGAWSPLEREQELRPPLGLLILDGLVIRRVGVAGRFGAELLGDGDVLRPWQREDSTSTLPRTGHWRVLRPTRIAILDGEFAVRLTRYPEVISELLGRTLRRSRHAAVNMAIVHQPRIDVRLHMLLWELADRWGRMGRDGVQLPLALTHAMLAELVAARRPTVTKALGDLAERGVVTSQGDGWLLAGDPPAELDEISPVSVPEPPPNAPESARVA
jgi:CRP/FNR family transcriptional regulator, cyclic AMP receptor protein